MAHAAYVLPAFMQVPTTYTTGTFTGCDEPLSAPARTWAGWPARDWNSGKMSTWPSTSTSNGVPTPGLCEVHWPITPPMLSTWSFCPATTFSGTTPSYPWSALRWPSAPTTMSPPCSVTMRPWMSSSWL